MSLILSLISLSTNKTFLLIAPFRKLSTKVSVISLDFNIEKQNIIYTKTRKPINMRSNLSIFMNNSHF